MRPEAGTQEHYFETDAQRERLLLLGHLVRNAHDPLYLRGPAGAGKTATARRLAERIGNELRVIEIDLTASRDLIAQAAGQFGTPPGDQAALLRAVDAAASGSGLLLVLDKADEFAVETLPMISHLQDRGARLLLVGRGGLGAANGEIDCQYIDLPAFDLVQTTEFLRQQMGDRANELDDETIARLHQDSGGRPGPLIDAWVAAANSERPAPKKSKPPATTAGIGRPWLRWVAGGAAAVVLLSALWFQDSINAWFAPAGDSVQVSDTAPELEDRAVGSVIQPLPVSKPAGDRPDPGPLSEVQQDDGPASAGMVPAQLGPTPAPPLSSRPAIDLPELSATPSGALADRPALAEEAADEVDPLEAVMRDAQAAAQVPQTEVSREAPAPVQDATEADSTQPVLESPPAPIAGSVSSADSDAPAVEAKPPAKDKVATAQQPSVAEADLGRPSEEPESAASSPAPVVERSSAVTVATPSLSPSPSPSPTSAVVAPAEASSTDAPAADPPGAQTGQADNADTEGPAPVVDRVPRPVASGAVAASPSADSNGQQAEVDEGARWLAGREPGRYTLQLIGARDRAALQDFIKGSGISRPYAIFARDLGGKPWYSLVAGDYPNREAAIAAKAGLPAGVQRADIWPRTFASIPKN